MRSFPSRGTFRRIANGSPFAARVSLSTFERSRYGLSRMILIGLRAARSTIASFTSCRCFFLRREVSIGLAFGKQFRAVSRCLSALSDWKTISSSWSSPIHARPSRIERVDSSVERARSVSSIRSRNLPPVLRA